MQSHKLPCWAGNASLTASALFREFVQGMYEDRRVGKENALEAANFLLKADFKSFRYDRNNNLVITVNLMVFFRELYDYMTKNHRKFDQKMARRLDAGDIPPAAKGLFDLAGLFLVSYWKQDEVRGISFIEHMRKLDHDRAVMKDHDLGCNFQAFGQKEINCIQNINFVCY